MAAAIRTRWLVVLVLTAIAMTLAPSAAMADTEYQPQEPERVLDTRDEAIGDHNGSLGAGDVLVHEVADTGDVAVAVNVTVANASTASHLRIWPGSDTDPEEVPEVSSINFRRGTNIANMIVTDVDENGNISIYNHNGDVDVILDVVGVFPSGTDYEPQSPDRVLDTRDEAIGDHDGTLGEEDVLVHNVGAATDVAVAVNVTVANASTASHLRIWPGSDTDPEEIPEVSSINFRSGSNIANMIVTDVDENGNISIYNHNGEADVILDVVGVFPGDS